jgi:ribulose-phosphate 3-epimerase
MSYIVPAILEDTPEAFLSRQSSILKFPGVKRIQVDIADGQFTERKTISPSDIDILNPLYEWEAHLMVKNPEEYLFDLKLAGFNCVIVHFESFQSNDDIKKIADLIRSIKMSPGIAVSPDTAIEKVRDTIIYFDQVLLLAVHPGFQGQQFTEEVFGKIVTLRSWDLNVKIEVDGGIKLEQAQNLAEIQIDYIVVGSALFDLSGNILSPSENFEKFQAVV